MEKQHMRITKYVYNKLFWLYKLFWMEYFDDNGFILSCECFSFDYDNKYGWGYPHAVHKENVCAHCTNSTL